MSNNAGRSNSLANLTDAADGNAADARGIARAFFAARDAMLQDLPPEVLNSPAVTMMLAIVAAPDSPALTVRKLAEAVRISPASAERWVAVLLTYKLVTQVANSDAIALTVVGRDIVQRAISKAITEAKDLVPKDSHQG